MLYQIKDTIVWIQMQNVHAWIRTRTVKVRTALSRPCPAIQTDKGKFFFKNPERIRKSDRHRTGPATDRAVARRLFQIRVRFETLVFWEKIENDKSKFSREFTQTFYSLSTPKYFLFHLNDEIPISSRVTSVKIG